MLICNNCGTTNRDDALVCVNCRMQNGFTKRPQQNQTETIMCVNCGNHFVSDLSRCPTCRFPITKKAQSKAPDTSNLQQLRKLNAG